MDLTGKKCLVFGNGVSGKSVLDRVANLNGKGELYNGTIDRKRFDFCVISPYMSIYSDEYARIISSGLPCFSEPDFAYLTGTDTTFGVTGTNGKTTVVRYIEQLCSSSGMECKAIGNIGYPMSSYYGNLGICELSSFMLEQSSYLACDYSVITNIAPDHLDRHRSFSEYRRQKLKLFMLTRKGVAIKRESPFYNDVPGNKLKFEYSLNGEGMLYVEKDRVIYNEGVKKILYEGEYIPTGYELENFLQALSLCIMAFGVKESYFQALPLKKDLYRMQYIGKLMGKNVFNDSKGTNIAATIAGLNSLEGRTVLIVGGYDKGENYSLLNKNLGNCVLFVLGQNADKIVKAAERDGVIYIRFSNLFEAVRRALEYECDNILFSPTCASFDEYSNYEERGKRFNEILAALS